MSRRMILKLSVVPVREGQIQEVIHHDAVHWVWPACTTACRLQIEDLLLEQYAPVIKYKTQAPFALGCPPWEGRKVYAARHAYRELSIPRCFRNMFVVYVPCFLIFTPFSGKFEQFLTQPVGVGRGGEGLDFSMSVQR